MELANPDVKTTEIVGTPVKSAQSLPIVESDSTCAPSIPECRAQPSPNPVCRYPTRLTRSIPPTRLDL